jgi:hypothetical protein
MRGKRWLLTLTLILATGATYPFADDRDKNQPGRAKDRQEAARESEKEHR